jgi:hypothetical protein
MIDPGPQLGRARARALGPVLALDRHGMLGIHETAGQRAHYRVVTGKR